MAEYLTTDTDLQTVANAIRTKTGGSASLSYPDGFASAIQGIGADCNATAAQIMSGRTAYVGNSKITGTMTSKAAETYNVSATAQTIASGQYLSGAQTIRGVTTSNLSAGNIKAGVTVKVGDTADDDRIAGVTGTFTNDATAAAGNILSGKTAYVNGSKVTGTIPSVGVSAWNAWGSNRTIIAAGKYTSGAQTINAVVTSNLTAANVKKGTTVTVKSGDYTISSVTGTLAEAHTSLPQSGYCYIPFMWQAGDAYNVRFYWQSNGFRIATSGASDSGRQFMVPRDIKMTYYPEDTSTSTTSKIFKAGTVYAIGAYSSGVAQCWGGEYSTFHIFKVTSFEAV